jgi:hypothetical protein
MRYLTLSLFVLIAACQVSKTGDKAPSSSSSDNVIGAVSQNDDTATSLRKTAVPPVAEYRDSADVFDPDGYYSPTESLTTDGRTIKTLELHTVDVYYGGELHYERPRLVQPPDVRLIVSEPSTGSDRSDAEQDSDKASTYPCAAARIAPDSLSVRCAGTPVGDVTIEGHFLDKGRNYWSKFAEQSVELLVARVVVTRDGRIVHDAVHRFTYFTGD